MPVQRQAASSPNGLDFNDGPKRMSSNSLKRRHPVCPRRAPDAYTTAARLLAGAWQRAIHVPPLSCAGRGSSARSG
jgi:hypothetical protein